MQEIRRKNLKAAANGFVWKMQYKFSEPGISISGLIIALRKHWK
jgi:hypothetical protein